MLVSYKLNGVVPEITALYDYARLARETL